MPDPTWTNLEGGSPQAPREEHHVTEAGLRRAAAAGSPSAYGDEASERLGERVAEQDRLIVWLRDAIRRREALLVEAKGRELALEGELGAVLASISWRITAPLRSLSRRHTRAATLLRRGTKLVYWTVTLQLPRRLRARRKGLEASRQIKSALREGTYEKWVDVHDTLTSSDMDGMRAFVQALEHRPLVSVLMPVFNSPEHFLREAIDSVRAQVYGNWELCIADDASTAPHVRTVLDEYARGDDRIRVAYRPENGGISAASNSALELARGELLGVLDHDDVLRPHALFMAVRAFNDGPHVAYVYSDEDRIDEAGQRFGPHFKPDWSPALLLCQNYLCHFSVFRTELARHVGGFRSTFDGSQDWDIALRMIELLPPEAVVHVPHVLYHWRAIPGSVAAEADAKPWAIETGRRATEDHLRRTGRPGYIVPVGNHHDVRFAVPRPRPLVSVIVPSTGRLDLLERCLGGLLGRTDYEEVEVLVAVDEHAYREPSRLRSLVEVTDDPRLRVLAFPSRSFNHAWIVNWAASQAMGDLLLFLNASIEPREDDWLQTMVGHVLQERVGAVGALLLRPDKTIEHAGVLIGGEASFGYLYRGRLFETPGHWDRAWLTHDLSAVTGACMLVRRGMFDELKGLDEALPGSHTDVDFCLRLRRAGWRVLITPHSVLYQHETASFGSPTNGRDAAYQRGAALLHERWGAQLSDDPMHNPNLALDAAHPSRLAFPPRVSYPWRHR